MSPVAKGAAVVAGWFAGNAVLAALLPMFGERPFAVVLYAVSTALPASFAVAILTHGGRNPDAEGEFELGAQAIWTLPAALGLVLVGVGSFAGVVAAWLGGLLVFASVVQLLRGSAPARAEAPHAAA